MEMQKVTEEHHKPNYLNRKRSNSRTRHSRPTTPLRPSSRLSFRDSARDSSYKALSFPLNSFEPAFAELSDAMADLEANMMHLQHMHENLARFGEYFASFLYGLHMNAFCVDFPEAPIPESFGRDRQLEILADNSSKNDTDVEATFMTTNTSFIDNPPTTMKQQGRVAVAENRQSRLPFARGIPSTDKANRRTEFQANRSLNARGRAIK